MFEMSFVTDEQVEEQVLIAEWPQEISHRG